MTDFVSTEIKQTGYEKKTSNACKTTMFENHATLFDFFETVKLGEIYRVHLLGVVVCCARKVRIAFIYWISL